MKLRILSTARLSFALASALAALFAAPSAHATTITWDANAGTALQTDGAGVWLTANQWWNGSANVNWTSGDDAVFGNGGAGGAVTLASPTTIGSLTFNSFTGTYTLGTSTQTITLNNGITMNSGAGAATLISPITLGAAQSWTNNDDSLLTIGTGAVTNGGFLLTVGGTGNTTVSSVIQGSGGLTKSGAGILTLSGANTFAGQLTVQNGTLSINTINNESANGTLGNSASSVILGNTGAQTGTLRYTGATASSTKKFTLATGGTGAFEVTTGANTLSLTGLIDGDGGLTKTGAGTLTLSATNTYTGATTVNAGTLKLDFSAAGAPSTNIISSSSGLVLGGGTLNLTGKASTTNSQAFNGTTLNPGLSAITLTANATANPLSLNLGAITRNAGSVLRITQPAGTLSASNGVLTTSGTASTILLSNGVAFATIGTTDWAGMDATNTWITPVTYTAATATSLSGNATRPNGTTTLSSDTTITSLRMTGASQGNVTINAGSTLTTGGILMSSDIGNRGASSIISGPGSLRGPAGQDLVVLQYQGNFDNFPLFISAPIVDNVSATGLTYFASFASNALTLTGSNTYTGVTRILGGVLQIGNGGTTGSLDPSSQIVNNGSLTINRSDNMTFSNSISGTGTLTKSGAGAMLLTGNNTYSGNTTVNGGTLQIGADTALGSSILVAQGGAIEASGTSRTITTEVLMSLSSSVVGSQDLTFASNFIQASGSSLTLTNNLVAGKKLTINGNVGIQYQNNNEQTLTFSGTGDTVINGFIYKVYARTGGLSKSGAGTLTLSGASANTYDGLTTVSGGTLALTKVNGVSGVRAIPAALTIGGADNTAATVQYAASTTNPDMMGTGVVTLNGRGILDFNGATDTIGNVAIVSTGATTTNPTPIINTAGGGNLTIGTLGITPVAGFTSVVNAGTGTLTLGGDVTFNAATTGQAQISGTALSLGAANRTFTVGLGTGAGQDLLIDAPITGVGRALTKSGAGRLALANTNTYTGATNVSAGTLAVNGTGSINSSAVTVNGGTFRYNSSVAYTGTLTYASGTVGGTNLTGSLNNLTISSGQTLSPGNSPGTATTGSQTWAGGGTYDWEINDANATAGADPGWDLLSGTGTLTISATSGSQFNLNLYSLSLLNVAGSLTDFNNANSYNWLIADFASVSGFSANAFNVIDTNFSNNNTLNGTFGVALGDTVLGGDNSQIYLTYTSIPEPRAALLGGLGLLALLRRRR